MAGMNAFQLKADRDLARRLARGSEKAFDAFFEEYFPRLFRFTLTRTDGDVELAEEVVQRTMCKVVDKMSSYRGEALLFTWLCQICRNELADLLRRRGREAQHSTPFEDIPEIRAALETIAVNRDDPEHQRAAAELARFVRVTLAHLPLNYASALELKYIRGYSVEEIGRHLNVTGKAAESMLSRARAAFRDGFRSLWDVEPEYLLK